MHALTRSLAFFLALAGIGPAGVPASAPPVPRGDAQIVFAGGCFWGVQGVFERLVGVASTTAGYSGGRAEDATYARVSTGATGHAESVSVVYDPRRLSIASLMRVYFLVAHDPTELDYQGPDRGSQYRSEIFYTTTAQRDAARGEVRKLTRDGVFSAPIVTRIVPLAGFYPAEGSHQYFLDRHPQNEYIVANDLPKIDALRRRFPGLVR